MKNRLNYWVEKVPYSARPSAQHVMKITKAMKASVKSMSSACGNGSCGCSGDCECSGPCDGGCGTGEGD